MKRRYFSPNRLAKLKSVKSTDGEELRMWELGYITPRSAKWRNYLVGQFGSVYKHRISSAQSLACLPRRLEGTVVMAESDCPPEGRVRCVNRRGTLLSEKSHDFGCPCSWVDGNGVDDTVKSEDDDLIMTDASKI